MNNPRVINHRERYEQKTRLVVVLTAITMVVEIGFGYYTNSMALLADGWHMSSHAFALGLTWLAYVIARKYSDTGEQSFNQDKLLALSGFSSAIILLLVAVVMAVQSVSRLINPVSIKFSEAIFVAIIGLIVNAMSAVLLHHDHHHGDQNIRAAYLHVLADGLTSITAIIALLAGMYFKLFALDAFSGIISSIVITRWSFELIRDSGKVLVDFRKNGSK